MSGPILVRNVAGSVTLYLELSAGGAATGLTFSDVTVDILKSGAGSFVNKVLTVSNFTELSGGFYELDLDAADLDTLGNLVIRTTGGTIQTTVLTAFVAEAAPANPTGASPPNTIAIFGWLYGPDGEPSIGKAVSARILERPLLLDNSTEGIALTQDLVTVTTTSDGFFTIDLVIGSTVDIKIPAADYSRVLTVPSVSKNLFSIA